MQGMVWTACKSFSKKVTLPFSLSKLQVYCNFCSNDLLHAEQPWSSGMMLACHAGDPGSIPGGCSFAASLAALVAAARPPPSRRLQFCRCVWPPSSPPLARLPPGGCNFAAVLAALVAAARPPPSHAVAVLPLVWPPSSPPPARLPPGGCSFAAVWPPPSPPLARFPPAAVAVILPLLLRPPSSPPTCVPSRRF